MAATGSIAAALARAALPVLLRLPPEIAHSMGLRGIDLLRHFARAPTPPSNLAVDVLGLQFSHPLGLAAGFDKNGQHLDALGALGFSHVEVGTVTPRPQPGNPRPRLFRRARQRALINRMGFNNAGAVRVAANLRRADFRGVRGVSIGKNADTPFEAAAADYVDCLKTLYEVADYFAINVSSPNTERLRELQTADALGGIVAPLLAERSHLEARHGRRVPLLVKISPDLAADELRFLCAALVRHGVDGVIATNTTTLQRDINGGTDGGVSGAPLTERSLEVLRALRRELGPDFPIINVGGVMTAQDVRARLSAGANLVQVYTGFVYRGPALLAETMRALTS